MAFNAIAAAVAIASAAYQIDQSKEAQEAQNDAADREKTMSEIENARKRRRAVAQRRIQQGQVNNAAAVSNTTGASGPVGAAGAMSSDFGSGMSAFNSRIALNNQRLGFLEDSSQAQANAQLGSSIAQIGSALGGTDWSGALGKGTEGVTDAAAAAGSSGQSFAYPGGYRSGVTFQRTG